MLTKHYYTLRIVDKVYKTELVYEVGQFVGIGFGIEIELYRLHKRILEELIAIRKQVER